MVAGERRKRAYFTGQGEELPNARVQLCGDGKGACRLCNRASRNRDWHAVCLPGAHRMTGAVPAAVQLLKK